MRQVLVRQLPGHMLEHVLRHVPVRHVLEHVPRHVLRHVPQNRQPDLPSFS